MPTLWGGLQAKAIKKASCFPSSWRWPPGWRRSVTAAFNPRFDEALADTPDRGEADMERGGNGCIVRPRARVEQNMSPGQRGGATLPFLVRARRCARSSWVSVTLERLVRGHCRVCCRIPWEGPPTKIAVVTR